MELINRHNLKDLKELFNSKYYEKILIVGGNQSFYKSGAAKLIRKLTKNKKTFLYLKKKKIPEIYELIKLIKEIKKFKPNLIVSIGGGAVMDLAKISNCMTDIDEIIPKVKNNSYKISKKFCDIIAIPMTAGSGAEVTTNAVLYIGKEKFSIESSFIKPNHMALFPHLVINNKKKKIIHSSAFDCFAQAVESMFSLKSNEKSIEYSKKSLDLFDNNYKSFVKNKSFEKGYLLSLASYYSGKAISISKTIAPHAVSYPFTSFFGVNHGYAVSITFDGFLKYNYENISKSKKKYDLNNRYEMLFKFLKIKNIEELSNKISEIKKELSLESQISKINKNIPKKIDLIVDNVNVQRMTNNPVEVKKKDILNILKKTM
ncbi:iron-containing alcohol dehydrogenase [Pelagibacterales bacterium SAG-MED39]|nr:iron-containing alcohol dehydrogenase [Pelagibacterales bacterium SAG-MED39]